jgi:hypothetical protein
LERRIAEGNVGTSGKMMQFQKKQTQPRTIRLKCNLKPRRIRVQVMKKGWKYLRLKIIEV